MRPAKRRLKFKPEAKLASARVSTLYISPKVFVGAANSESLDVVGVQVGAHES